MNEAILAIVGIVAGAAVTLLIVRKVSKGAPMGPVQTDLIAERIRAVGKIVGLEVHAKEIATSRKGWSWLPPLILSQAKIAMIFHFEKQYYVDLSRVRASDVEEIAPGRFRIVLPGVEGTLRLTDVVPYDIQAGRILGLLDVIQMDATTQKSLMGSAQEEAAKLYEKNQGRYEEQARQSVAHELESLLRLFDVEVEVEWRSTMPTGEPEEVELALAGT